MEIWLSDAGAYPVMFCLAFTLTFATVFGIHYMAVSPDVHLWGQSREHFLRGRLANEYSKKGNF